MSTHTTNYNLEKPDASDNFEDFRANYNQNMDIIDQNLGGGGGSSSLAGLSDVSITSAQDGQVLKYDAQNSEWVNANESGGGSYTAGDGIDITSNVISVDTAFTEAGTRQNIASGDTFATILGKIKKFFTDLKAVAFSGSYNDLSNKPTIPTATSDLVNDSDFVSDASYVHTDENFTSAEKTKLSGIESGAEVNVQSDWNEADNTADDYIKNKPSIPTNTSDLNNDSGFLTSADVSTVAISGDYDDLLNKPTIPTKVSDLNNDSGFTSVSWTQIQATGTKIAEIDIDGTPTDIYAPQGSGGGGGYDTIEDADGTALTQRDTVQFGGYLQATDDAVNSKTVITDGSSEVSWNTWQTKSSADKQGKIWVITDAPSAEGSVEVDLLNPLWTNPSPTSSFASQNITLSSSDYDFLLFVVRVGSGSNRQFSAITSKGSGVIMSYTVDNYMRSRLVEYTNDTKYAVADAVSSTGGATAQTNNNACIPVAIYGIKKKITLSFDALAESVSTLASKCMLSDGDSVQDRVDGIFYADGTYSLTYNGINKAQSNGTFVGVYFMLGKIVPNNKTLTVNSCTINELYRYDGSSVSGATGSATFNANFPDRINVRATKSLTANAMYYVGATVNFTIS